MEQAEWSIGWPAPAKVNLFLHVTGRREDGLHELQTLFQFLDHADALAFRVRADGRIERAFGADDIDPADDLALRAARLLRGAHGHAARRRRRADQADSRRAAASAAAVPTRPLRWLR
ncbi:MAG: hypothetical protein U5K33_04265 [Halofilum sp. (in: g-proteobacteria)]|nr:hypothetical protein [Halofilum sp. (in: g-proteobacteria)]